MTREDAGRFLARWAKRKQAARKGEPLVEPGEPQVESEQEDENEAGSKEAASEAADTPPPLPDIETLGSGSDFKPFMQAGVPSALRNQALQKLWRSNPLYNTLDMLDDYCEDYTDAACAVPGIKTLYKVGQGFVSEMLAEDEVAGVQETAAAGEPEQLRPEQPEQPEDDKPDATKPG